MTTEKAIKRGRGPQRKPTKRAEAMVKVFSTLEGDRWMNGDEVAAATGLTYPQVVRAVAHLRESFPDFPILSHTVKGYRYSTQHTAALHNDEEVSDFRRSRASTGLTIMRRTYYGAIAPFLGQIKSDNARLIEKQFIRLLEDVEDWAAIPF